MAYTTQAKMERMFSVYGVLSFADHDVNGSNDTGVIDDCISWATEEINLYTWQRYTAATLATLSIVDRWATTLAVYKLTMLRGNPPPESLAEECKRIFEQLADVQSGKLTLPNAPVRSDLTPGFANLTIDRRYQRNTVRVTPSNSKPGDTDLPRHEIVEVNHYG